MMNNKIHKENVNTTKKKIIIVIYFKNPLSKEKKENINYV